MASADDITSTRIISRGGLNTNENSIVLSNEAPGCATALVNYEVSKSGGYRRINGIDVLDPLAPVVGGVLAEGPVLGITKFYNTVTKVYQTIAARKKVGSATYAFWLLNGGTNWTEIVTPVRNMTGPNRVVTRVRSEQFNFGSGNHIIFVDGVNPALWYNGTAWEEILSTNLAPTPTAPGGDQVVDAPNKIAVFKNHIFLADDNSANGEGRFVHSGPSLPYDWTAASGAGQLFPGFNVLQLKPWRDELYVFGREKIKRAVPNATAGFLLQSVTDDIGLVSEDSVLEVGSDIIFLSPDGIRPVAGTDKINDVELGLLSRDIQPIIDDLIVTPDVDTLVGVVIRSKTQFRYFYGDETFETSESKGIIGGIRTFPRQGGRSWEFGELLGIRASCAWSGFENGREVVLHGDYDGTVYQQEVGNSFAGEDIFSIYSTPFIDMDATDIRKSIRKLTTFIDAEGDITILLGISANWNVGQIILPANYTLNIASGNSLYDDLDSIYDDLATLYGGDSRTLVKENIQGSYFSIQFNFVNIGTDAPFTIQGFVPEFTLRGRQ